MFWLPPVLLLVSECLWIVQNDTVQQHHLSLGSGIPVIIIVFFANIMVEVHLVQQCFFLENSKLVLMSTVQHLCLQLKWFRCL